MPVELTPLILSLKLAAATTVVLLVLGIPVAYWLAFTKHPLKCPIEALVAMPLVLPPTVLGFYLLLALSPAGLAFSFFGLLVGSVFFSLPFMVNPLKAGFQNVPKTYIEACDTLGKSRWETLVKVLLANIKPSVLTAIVMTFAHTLGEFGVVLMIGGNIPGHTRTASMAIFSEVEALNYSTAHFYAAVMVGLSFAILLSLYWFNRRFLRETF